MATQQTANRGYPYPTTSETPNVPRDLEALATALDVDVDALLPVGSIVAHAGSATPTGWLLCNGGSFSSAVYPALFAVLGSPTLPNLTDRFLKGSTTAGSTGGSRTITVDNMPSHNPGGVTAAMSANAVHAHSGSTSTEGAHGHSTNFASRNEVFSAGSSGTYAAYNVTGGSVTSTAGAHSHSLTTSSVNIDHLHVVYAQGGGTDYEQPFYTVRYLIKAT